MLLYAFVLVSLVAAQDNIMSCMFCEVITEELGKEPTAAGTIQGMFKRCSRMGLVEPVCDQFVTEYAKRIFILARSGVPPAAICDRLSLCGERR
ncbi:surfactant protein B [Ancylostoma ceylanicum]|uniref:Surfactant protein B n=1 Tax=Ancylostoma ceylanicum TaxID=53326 RepID=A0A0D6LUG5_9BILA|nr:surfactant protein B [Ancylostoma ceylanicum]